jgi:UDP-N-acetylmuramoylalanine--D-glutamate ligase
MSDSVRSVVILGLARQGVALARYFAQRGTRVTVSDSRPATALDGTLATLRDLDLSYVLGHHPLSLLDGCDLLCLSGGVSTDLPIVEEAVRRRIPLSNDAQEFLAQCAAPVVGITGSAGKTTTTSLVGAMLDHSGFRTWVGGNIGNPLVLQLEAIQPADRVVMELSSFQLELMTVSPRIAGVLNITPNHLDRHKTMKAYIQAKRQIVANQRPGDIAVLGYDEPNARALAQQTRAEVRFFSATVEVPCGAFLRDGRLVLRRETGEIEVVEQGQVPLRGAHNVANALAAIVLADAAGATVEGMREAIISFIGVTHRLEEIRVLRDVLWVNDSIATAPERVLAALSAFDEPIILLAGGRDKDLPWQPFAERVVERVRVLVLFGEAAGMIEAKVSTALEQARTEGKPVRLEAAVRAGTLEDAVAAAAERAQAGEVVLMSPGGTSFDAYQDFAERGDRFRECVNRLS